MSAFLGQENNKLFSRESLSLLGGLSKRERAGLGFRFPRMCFNLDTKGLDCCAAVQCSPKAWSGLLQDYSRRGIITKWLPGSTRYYCKFVLRYVKMVGACPKYRDSCNVYRYCWSTQPANSNRLLESSLTVKHPLAAALIWRDINPALHGVVCVCACVGACVRA